MKYFFISGTIGGIPFDTVLIVNGAMFNRKELGEFVSSETGVLGNVSVIFFKELTEEEFEMYIA